MKGWRGMKKGTKMGRLAADQKVRGVGKTR